VGFNRNRAPIGKSLPIIGWVILHDGGRPIWGWLMGEATAFLSIVILVLFLLITLLGV